MTSPSPRSCGTAGLPAKRLRTRTALVDAALTLIAEKGPEFVSIDDLVRAAGMARGTFYNYFATWEDVLVAVAQRMDDDYVRRIESRLPPGVNDTATLACMLRGMIQTCVDDPEMGWAWVRMGPRVNSLLNERPVAQTHSKQAVRRLCGNVSDTAAFCMLGGTTFATARRLLEKELPVEELDVVIAMLLRGIGAPADQIEPALAIARDFVTSEVG